MNVAWNWGTLVAMTVAYWLLVILVAWKRWPPKGKGTDTVRKVSENRIVVTYESEIDLRPVVVVLLGPPLVGLILLLVR